MACDEDAQRLRGTVVRVELLDALLREEHVRAALGGRGGGDLPDDAVLRGDAAVGEDHRVADGLPAARCDDHLVVRRGLASFAQDEAGQRRGLPGVRLDDRGDGGIRAVDGERNGDIGDHAVHAGQGRDVTRGVDGQRRALAQGDWDVLRHLHLLRCSDHDVDRGIALGREPSAHPGFDEHSEPRHQGARDEHRDRHSDEAAPVVTKIRPDQSAQRQRPRHHHSPSALMRSLIWAGVAPSR